MLYTGTSMNCTQNMFTKLLISSEGSRREREREKLSISMPSPRTIHTSCTAVPSPLANPPLTPPHTLPVPPVQAGQPITNATGVPTPASLPALAGLSTSLAARRHSPPPYSSHRQLPPPSSLPLELPCYCLPACCCFCRPRCRCICAGGCMAANLQRHESTAVTQLFNKTQVGTVKKCIITFGRCCVRKKTGWLQMCVVRYKNVCTYGALASACMPRKLGLGGGQCSGGAQAIEARELQVGADRLDRRTRIWLWRAPNESTIRLARAACTRCVCCAGHRLKTSPAAAGSTDLHK